MSGVNVSDGVMDEARNVERGTIWPNFHLTKKSSRGNLQSQHFFLLTLR